MTRRSVLITGAAAAAGAGCAPRAAALALPARPRLRTPLCDLFGIEYPILQSGMGSIAGPELALEVSKAGGLGAIGATDLDPDELKAAIQKIREGTDRPFAVNLLLPDEYLHEPVADPATAAAVQAALDPLRKRLGIPPRTDTPKGWEDFIPALVDVIVEAKPRVFSAALGIPSADLMKRIHDAGSRVTVMVTSVEDGRKAEAAGADVVIAQGWEAGGHRSHLANPPDVQTGAVGTLALVREMSEKLHVPVVAAGGISDGRGIAAALALGAAGVLLGTRFVATAEANASEGYKRSLTTGSGEQTLVTNRFSGRFARLLRNELVDALAHEGPLLPYPLQARAVSDLTKAARKLDDVSLEPMMAGQGIGVLDRVQRAGEVVGTLVLETRDAVRALRAALDV